MAHAALTPLLGHEFDGFLGASIDDDRNAPWLSAVSALAQLDVDPWKEAADLARMPRERAVERLASLIAALPQGLAASRPSEVAAARLVALLPRSGRMSAPAPAILREAASAPRPLLLIGLGVLVVLLIVYFTFAAHAENSPYAEPAFAIALPSLPAQDSRPVAALRHDPGASARSRRNAGQRNVAWKPSST